MRLVAKRSFLVLGLLPFFLSSCAEIELASHAAKGMQEPEVEKKDGLYKIGNPYQIDGVWYYPTLDYEYKETGIASWYGPGFHGKQTANGEIYDETAMTAAHRTLPMPTMVRVTNLDNGRSIVVRVNDRGPFKHGRIIDLSRRGAELLNFETAGTAKVKVEILPEESRRLAAILQSQQDAGNAPDPAPIVPVAEVPIEPDVAVTTVADEPTERVAAASTLLYDETFGADPPAQANTTVALADVNGDLAVTTANDAGPVWHAAPVPWPSDDVSLQPIEPTQIYVQAGAFQRRDYADYLRKRLAVLGPTQVSQAVVDQRLFYRVRVGPLENIGEADEVLYKLQANGITDARVVVD